MLVRVAVQMILRRTDLDNKIGAVKAQIPLPAALVYLGAGLSVGLSGLASGFAVGIVGDSGVRGTGQQPRLFVGMVILPYY